MKAKSVPTHYPCNDKVRMSLKKDRWDKIGLSVGEKRAIIKIGFKDSRGREPKVYRSLLRSIEVVKVELRKEAKGQSSLAQSYFNYFSRFHLFPLFSLAKLSSMNSKSWIPVYTGMT